jgi:integrase/recombinase XerD
LEAKDGFQEAVAEFVDSLKVERGASAHTCSAYSRDLAAAAAHFRGSGAAEWAEVTDSQAGSYLASLAGYKPATVRRRVSALRTFCGYWRSRGRPMPFEPPSLAGMRPGRQLPKALSVEQVRALLAAPDVATPGGLRDRALLELVYGCGLRASEAAELTLAEVSLDTASLRVTGKRQKTRWVPIPRGTIRWMERYLAEGRPRLARVGSDRVFLGDRGGPFSRSQAYRIVERHARKSGVATRLGPHALRHSYAVHLLLGGADLRAVQELLGHASVDTTQVYTELQTEHLRAAYDAAHPRR